MPEYTPTSDEVRTRYAVSLFHTEHGADEHVHDSVSDGDAEFDRWLEARDRENRAIGWDEGERHESEYLSTYGQFCPGGHCNPYRGDNQ